MARPKKDPSDQKTEWLGFRLSAADREAIEAAAAKTGLHPSEYIRRAALHKKIHVIADARRIDPDLLLSLNRIGNNLNQLTRAFNATGNAPQPEQLAGTLAIIQDLIKQATAPR